MCPWDYYIRQEHLASRNLVDFKSGFEQELSSYALHARSVSFSLTVPVLSMAFVLLNSCNKEACVSESHPLSRLPSSAGGHFPY